MFRPGSIPWLVAFDVRLAWRKLGSRIQPHSSAFGYGRIALNVLSIAAFMHLVGWLIVLSVSHEKMVPIHKFALLDITIALSLLTAIGISIAISVNLLFVQSDLDLLLSSPLVRRNIFVARAVSIALQSIAFPALVFLPIADMAAMYDGAGWLAVYPVVLACGLIASATGVLITVLIVRMIGPRRARIVALALSTLLGATLFLGFEMPALLGEERKQLLFSAAANWLGKESFMSVDALIWYPARALQGELIPLFLTLLLGVAYFALAAYILSDAFAFAYGRVRGADVNSPAQQTAVRLRPEFMRVIFLKEWRLIYRDPQLLVQLSRQLIYLVPVAVIFLRESRQYSDNIKQVIVVCVLTLLAGQIADRLTWIAVCAEDMPALLEGTPRSMDKIRQVKMFAILLPLWVLTILLAFWFIWQNVAMALCLILTVAGATISMGIFHIWLPAPISGTDIRRRLGRGMALRMDRMLASLAVICGWCGVAFALITRHWLLAALAFAVALIGPSYAWYANGRSKALST